MYIFFNLIYVLRKFERDDIGMKKFVVLLFTLVMVISLSACSMDKPYDDSDKQTSSLSKVRSNKRKVGISMPTKSLERWSKDSSFLKKQFEDEGYDVEVTYADNDSDQQVEDIEKMIADGVDVLVIAAIDGETLTTPLIDAKGQNIPVISYDRLIMNTDAVSYYVSFDNYLVGEIQGKYIIDKLGLEKSDGKTYNMEITAGDTADNNAEFMFNGAMDVLKKYIDDGTIRIVSGQTSFEAVAMAQWSEDEARERMNNIIASYYSDGTKLDICLCSNDSTALGVTKSLQLNYKGGNIPIITGQDADEANLANIIDDQQAMTVYKNFSDEAVVTLGIVEEILHDKMPDESLCADLKYKCSYDVKSYDNGTGIIPSYLLRPELITKENYKEKLVDTGYYKLDKDGYPKVKQ